MEDYTAEMIRDMAFSFCPQCGTAIVPNHKGRPRKFCSPECRSRWNNTHPKPENWKTVRSKICPVCGREFSYRHQYGLERKYCSRACANKGRWKEGDANGRTAEHMQVAKEVAPTLMARDYKDPTTIAPVPQEVNYTVRRLTPTECARLQGFPDWWCRDLGTEDPTEEELAFWADVFETHRKIVTHAKKPKTEKQIRKWLTDPYTDSAK